MCSLPNSSIIETHPYLLQKSVAGPLYQEAPSGLTATGDPPRKKVTSDALPPPVHGFPWTTPFGESGTDSSTNHVQEQKQPSNNRKLKVNLDQTLIFPEIITTDLISWSTSQKLLYIVEPTVKWESVVNEAYECKSLKYREIAAETELRGWQAQVLPVEVGCRDL